MNVYYDNIIYFLQRSGGISRYWHELSLRLLLDTELSPYFIEPNLPNINGFREQLLIPKDRIISEKIYKLSVNRYLPVMKKLDNPSIFHSSYYRNITDDNTSKIVTVHDFTYEYFSKGLKKLVHSTQKGHAIKTAHGIICISESTKKDLLKFYPQIPEDRICVVHNGVSDDFYPSGLERGQILDKYELTDDTYTLFLGERGGYKNFECAVKASAIAGCRLLILGGKPLNEFEKQLLQKELKDRYKYFGFISNEAIRDLLSIGHCFLYPSLYEGFGIPVLEAMRCGCPVIASDCSSLPEAAGDAGLLVKDITPDGFAEKIALLNDKDFRNGIIKKGFDHSSKFSWDRCYEETKAFYLKTASKS